jgi:hypothetical protein
MSPTDHSDRIAHLQVLIECLNDWEPEGDWQRAALLTAWQANRYGLSVGQFNRLEKFLETEHRRAALAFISRHHQQMDLLGGQHGTQGR